MLKKSLRPAYRLASFATAILVGLVLAAPSASSLASTHPAPVFVNLSDTGKTVVLQAGQQLMVKLPMRDYQDNSWHITKISPNLKLVAGPDELRPVHWSPWTLSFQVFYFRRVSPGSADLVMEPNYFSKPLVLRVAGS